MSRSVLIAIALVGLFMVASATGAAAQQTVLPVPIDFVVCDGANSIYDINGDGVVGKSDWYYWRNLTVTLGCPFGSPAEGSCARLDLNGDGTIDMNDQNAFGDYFTLCARRITHPINDLPRNPVNPRPGPIDPLP